MKAIFNSAPTVLKPVFEYFYNNSWTIIDSCGQLLVERYGAETCLDFFIGIIKRMAVGIWNT